MDGGVGELVDIEEFSPRRAGAQTTIFAPETFASWNRRIRATTWLYRSRSA
jgi:hypothetical protein